MPRLVPRRQVRHLGALGAAGRADGRRLVRPRHVRAGQQALQVSPRALRPSVEVRLQGHHPALEGGEVGPRPADAALQEGRREVLRQHGLAPRQLLPLELEAAPVERGQHGPASATWSAIGRRRRKKYGLQFGVSEHLGASFTWFQSSHRADKTGPKAGVPYDGANPKYQDLYHFPAEPGDTGWYSNEPQLAAAVVRRDQGAGGQLPSRPALHRRRRAVRQRGRPEHDRPSLQLQRRRATAARSRSSTTANRSPKAAGSRTSNAASCRRSIPIPGRPTPRSATGSTTATGSSAR